MATLMVGHDLNTPGQDYGPLIEKLKSYGRWWHCLDSTWFVVASLTPTQLRDALKPLIDKNDELLVLDATGDAAAWQGFDENCSDWLKKNLG